MGYCAVLRARARGTEKRARDVRVIGAGLLGRAQGKAGVVAEPGHRHQMGQGRRDES